MLTSQIIISVNARSALIVGLSPHHLANFMAFYQLYAALRCSVFARAIGPRCEQFEAVVGHHDHVLPLRRQRPVLGSHGPAITRLLRCSAARVHHWLNGENQSWLQTKSCSRLSVMQHLWILVIHAANAVSAILAHDRIPLAVCDGLDRITHIAQRRARAHRPN